MEGGRVDLTASLTEQELDEVGAESVTLTYHGQYGEDVGWKAEVKATKPKAKTFEFTASTIDRAIIGACREATPVNDPAPEPVFKTEEQIAKEDAQMAKRYPSLLSRIMLARGNI